jgi:glucosyl-3-phosphoglycerate synthase
MSFGILQSFMKRMESFGHMEKLPEMSSIYKHFQAQDKTYQLVEKEVLEEERPPMISIPQYREKFHGAEK